MRTSVVAVIAIAATVLLFTPACAGSGDGASSDSLHWLGGHWCSGTSTNLVEEYWLPANGELMLGLSRTVKNGQVIAFEFLRIATVNGVVTFLAQPEGRPPTAFKQTASGENWIRFENPQHDFPTSIQYRREGDVLKAEIAGPGKDGKEKVIPFPYQKCAG
jgi:hypothetical protein